MNPPLPPLPHCPSPPPLSSPSNQYSLACSLTLYLFHSHPLPFPHPIPLLPLPSRPLPPLSLSLSQVLSQRRIQRLAGKPLAHTEFVQPLARIEPVFRDEFEKLAVRPPPSRGYAPQRAPGSKAIARDARISGPRRGDHDRPRGAVHSCF
jgi:hypothetical protein